jgi:hypothetical protein
MLEDYFLYRGVLKRLRRGALGAEMDRIAEHFSSLGYKRGSARIYLSGISRLGHFAAAIAVQVRSLNVSSTDICIPSARILHGLARCQRFNTRAE